MTLIDFGTTVQYPATFAQRALFTNYLLHPKDDAYDPAFVFAFRGDVDVERLRRSCAAAVTAAPGMQTRFHLDGPVITAEVDVRDREVSLRDIPAGVDEDRWVTRLAEERLQQGPIDVTDPDQIQMEILRGASGAYLKLQCSHLVGDAYTFYQLVSLISALYSADDVEWVDLCATAALHPGNVSAVKTPEASVQAYLQLLASASTLTHPELGCERTGDRITGSHHHSTFSGDSYNNIARSWAVSEFGVASTFFAAYAALLHRLSPQDMVVIGVPLANRAGLVGRRAYGYFVNTLPLPLRITAETTWADLVRSVSEGIRLLQKVQGLDLNDPSLLSRLPNLTSTAADNVVTFYKQRMVLDLPEVTVDSLPLHRESLIQPLGLTVSDDGNNFELDLWAADQLKASRPHEILRDAMSRLTTGPTDRVVTGSVLNVPVGTLTEQPRRCQTSIPEMISRVCASQPDRPAIVHGADSITYGELHSRFRAAAHALDAHGATHHVVVKGSKSIDALVVMLGVMASGRVYVPVAPDAPVERERQIINTITQAEAGEPTLIADTSTALTIASLANQMPVDEALPTLEVEDIAYVIFTSGSTGAPKGVQVQHGNVVDLMESTLDRFHLESDDVWCLFHSLAFDFSVWEIFGALFSGAVLQIPSPDEIRDPQAFAHFLSRTRVTVLNQTPSAFRRLCSALGECDLTAVRFMIFGGEALMPSDLLPWRKKVGLGAVAVNMYGITETTVHVTARKLSVSEERTEVRSLIGEPLWHLDLVIIDKYGRPVPDGVPGELLVTGSGLARGYLGKDGLTRARFFPIQHYGEVQRAYRTGDLAIRHEDGEISYRGRLDDQVQLRGHRIELGEVEASLMSSPLVEACVVRLVEPPNTEPYLAAWVSGCEPEALPEVRAHSLARVPAYMVPSRFCCLPAIPMNNNGKPDHLALAQAMEEQAHADKDVPSQTKTESPDAGDQLARQIARVWENVIGTGKVNIDDRFIEIGGTSMHVVSIHQEISNFLGGSSFSLVDLYEYPTPRLLANHLNPDVAPRADGAAA